MKIVCESCGAKYSIADEKVAGKVFKIRCKKCSAVIVVKGDHQEEGAGEEATKVFDYGADASWHVVVNGDQQGPLTPRQIGEMLADGRIDWEAYVWREGMDGWQPAKDVEPLVNAVMAESEGGGGTPKAGGSAYGTGQVFGGSSDMGADPFAASDDGGLSGVMAGSVGASAAGGGADLFAQSAKSPFAGGSDDEERMTNGSSPRISENQAMTGQRNENSVLFSLSNLQALATGTGTAPASNRPKAGMAQGEGSGLIDIRALASATQAVAEKPNGSSKESVEDLLAVGSAGSAFSAASLAAPVAQEKADSSKMLLYGMGAAILALGGVVAWLAIREPAAVPATAMTAVPPAAAAATALPPPGSAAPAAAPVQQPAQAEPTQDKEEPREASDDRGDRSEARSGGGERKVARKGGNDAPRAAERSSEPEKPAAAPPPPSKSSGDKSIDDLLDSALNGKPKPAAAAEKPTAKPSASEDLPASPSRDDVLSAMKGVTPRVQACGNGQTGVAMAKITVAGATGKVTSVDVSGQFAGTPIASCIVREVSKAKFSKFSNASFSVSYPFKI